VLANVANAVNALDMYVGDVTANIGARQAIPVITDPKSLEAGYDVNGAVKYKVDIDAVTVNAMIQMLTVAAPIVINVYKSQVLLYAAYLLDTMKRDDALTALRAGAVDRFRGVNLNEVNYIEGIHALAARSVIGGAVVPPWLGGIIVHLNAAFNALPPNPTTLAIQTEVTLVIDAHRRNPVGAPY